MDTKTLVRDASKIHACLYATTKGELYTNKPLKIYSPVRYTERKLSVVSNVVRIVGVFGIVVEDKYLGVCSVLAMMPITPTSTNIVEFGEDEYFEFWFDKGSMVCSNLDLVKEDSLAYKVYDEILAKGNVPWYMSYEDLGKLFVTAETYAGITLAANNVPLEMIAAAISRDPSDRTAYFRHRLQKIEDQEKLKPDYIPFRSVIYGATNTTAKLMGAYFDDGLMSALVNPSDKVEGVERLLRS